MFGSGVTAGQMGRCTASAARKSASHNLPSMLHCVYSNQSHAKGTLPTCIKLRVSPDECAAPFLSQIASDPTATAQSTCGE